MNYFQLLFLYCSAATRLKAHLCFCIWPLQYALLHCTMCSSSCQGSVSVIHQDDADQGTRQRRFTCKVPQTVLYNFVLNEMLNKYIFHCTINKCEIKRHKKLSFTCCIFVSIFSFSIYKRQENRWLN